MQEEKSASLTLGGVQEGCLQQPKVPSLLSLSSPFPPPPPSGFQPPRAGDACREKEKSPHVHATSAWVRFLVLFVIV